MQIKLIYFQFININLVVFLYQKLLEILNKIGNYMRNMDYLLNLILLNLLNIKEDKMIFLKMMTMMELLQGQELISILKLVLLLRLKKSQKDYNSLDQL
jgi:hypothetical protein